MTDRLTDEQIARWANQELSHEHGIGSTLVRACRELQERRAMEHYETLTDAELEAVVARNTRRRPVRKVVGTIPVGTATAEFLDLQTAVTTPSLDTEAG